MALALWAGSVAALAVVVLLSYRLMQEIGPWHRAAFARGAGEWREYIVDYTIALLVAANFIGFASSPRSIVARIAVIERPVRWLAGATFTLYLLHYPLARLLVAVSPWDLGTWQQVTLVYGGTLIGVFFVAQHTERKKRVWHNAAVSIANAVSSTSRLNTR